MGQDVNARWVDNVDAYLISRGEYFVCKKPSVTVVNEAGRLKGSLTVLRDDLWASPSSEQLNFPQYVKTLFEINAQAANRPS
jgi:hypothetical protein